MRRPLLWTRDSARARRSRFVWFDYEDGRFSLSALGVINGLLPSGWLLVCQEHPKSPATEG